MDAEIEKLERMDEDDIEALRNKRLQQLKKAQQQKQEWLQVGHGRYDEIPDEKSFFEAAKKSKKFVCHFYRDATFRCKIVDKHLTMLAQKHVETRFVKIDAEKCKFLVDRLRIVVLPTISLAMDGKIVDYVVGFDDLGGVDDFTTDILEWRIARAGVIKYDGDLLVPPINQQVKKGGVGVQQKTEKSIRSGVTEADSSDDDDW